jgi:hypothetical protein
MAFDPEESAPFCPPLETLENDLPEGIEDTLVHTFRVQEGCAIFDIGVGDRTHASTLQRVCNRCTKPAEFRWLNPMLCDPEHVDDPKSTPFWDSLTPERFPHPLMVSFTGVRNDGTTFRDKCYASPLFWTDAFVPPREACLGQLTLEPGETLVGYGPVQAADTLGIHSPEACFESVTVELPRLFQEGEDGVTTLSDSVYCANETTWTDQPVGMNLEHDPNGFSSHPVNLEDVPVAPEFARQCAR